MSFSHFRRIKSASIPETDTGLQYHLMIKSGDVAEYVLLPGDPDRVLKIASYWDEYRVVSRHREYTTCTGRYKGVSISAVSTGIGAPSTAIAIEELLRVGAHTFIRVGTTAALSRDIGLGDVIISVAAVRLEGTSKAYAPLEYPAFANYEVLLALIEAAETLGVNYHVGIAASTDSFYVGQERPGYRGYMPPWSKGLINMLRSLKVLNFEMEASVIFVLSSIYGVRAGSICAAIANRETDEFSPGVGIDDAIKVANEAVKILYEWDSIKRQRRKTYLSPSILIKHWHK